MSFYENFENHFRQSSNKRNALLFHAPKGEGISTIQTSESSISFTSSIYYIKIILAKRGFNSLNK